MRVVIESPYGHEDEVIIQRNIVYLKRCLKDSLDRGEAPFASHAIYPQVLNDQNLGERRKGVKAGFVWGAMAEMCIVYEDYGLTQGMKEGMQNARKNWIPITNRQIGKNNLIDFECLKENCNCPQCRDKKREIINWD